MVKNLVISFSELILINKFMPCINRTSHRSFALCLILQLLLWSCLPKPAKELKVLKAHSELYELKLEVLAEHPQITMPFAIEFLPDNRMLVANRLDGKLYLLDKDRELSEVNGLPKTLELGGAGLHDVIIHPNYEKNGWLYLSYVEMRSDSLSTLVVDRAKLDRNTMIEREGYLLFFPITKNRITMVAD
jgi:glucose/arabinose dehydrogenase